MSAALDLLLAHGLVARPDRVREVPAVGGIADGVRKISTFNKVVDSQNEIPDDSAGFSYAELTRDSLYPCLATSGDMGAHDLEELTDLLAAFAVWPSRAIFSFDPLAFAFRFDWDRAAVVMLGLVAAGSLVRYRFWCRYLCPLGAVLSLFEKVALLTRLAPGRRSSSCHVGVVVGEDLDCLRCSRCATLAPAPSRLPAGRAGDLLVVALVAAVLVAGAARVVAKWTPPPAPAPAVPWTDPMAEAEEMCVSPEGDGALEGSGTTLYRKDNKQYEFQRDVDLEKLRRLLESGRLSDREADYSVPLDSGL